MKITLSLDDDLYADYLRESQSRKIPLNTILNERLLLAEPLDPRNRPIVISDTGIVQHLEQVIGGGSIKDQYDLSAKVTRLARIGFGDHTFKITPGQFEELKFRATKTGRTVEQLIADLYTRMAQDLFRTVA
jgi:hypothetical protein